MSPVFIIDTNVVVAGLTTSQADSPVVRILDAMLRANFRFALSADLFVEYRRVLLRPKLLKLHRLEHSEIDAVLTDLVRHAIVLLVPPSQTTPIAPDPGDQFLLDLLSSRDSVVQVTGDKLLQQRGPLQHRVMTPQAFTSTQLS